MQFIEYTTLTFDSTVSSMTNLSRNYAIIAILVRPQGIERRNGRNRAVHFPLNRTVFRLI